MLSYRRRDPALRRARTLAIAEIVALACGIGPARAQVGSSVQVAVEGVRGTEGVVTVSLCTRQEYAADDCRLMRSTAATPPRSIVSFESVPPGRYAAVVFHDRDRNGEVARGSFGIPIEGVGFSRNPSLWRRPRFDEVAMAMGSGAQFISVTLKFEPHAARP